MSLGKDFENGIGTGGYIFEHWEPGVGCRTKKNPNYWKAGRAHFDSIETLSINDVNARTSAIKTGQIHFMDCVERKTVQLMKRAKGLEAMAVTGTMHHHAHAHEDEAL